MAAGDDRSVKSASGLAFARRTAGAVRLDRGSAERRAMYGDAYARLAGHANHADIRTRLSEATDRELAICCFDAALVHEGLSVPSETSLMLAEAAARLWRANDAPLPEEGERGERARLHVEAGLSAAEDAGDEELAQAERRHYRGLFGREPHDADCACEAQCFPSRGPTRAR